MPSRAEREEEEERKRRRRIYWIMKMKEQEPKTPPRFTTLNQEHNLWKDREARRERRNG